MRPNAAINTLSILTSSLDIDKNYIVNIYNTVGVVKHQQTLNKSIDIDVSKLQNGLYLIKIMDDGLIVYTSKFIKIQ